MYEAQEMVLFYTWEEIFVLFYLRMALDHADDRDRDVFPRLAIARPAEQTSYPFTV